MKPQPTKLYKYLDPARIDNVLPEDGPSTLRLSPSSVLNDPFEVMPGLDDFVSESMLAKATSKMKAEFPDDKDMENMCRRELQQRRFRLGFTSKYRNIFDSMLGLVSLSATPTSTLMWAHYASNFKGFVVGYTFEAVAALVPEDLSGTLAEVEYQDERPRWASVDDFERQESINLNIIKCYTTKSRAWEYEQEWRLILPVPTSPSKVELVKIPRIAVCEVIVSEFTDDKLISTLTARAATYPAATMMRVLPSQKTFECNIEGMSE